MRPLFIDHTRPEVWDHPYQYMFGDDLLVAPVCWEGADELDVYLPAGDWVDVWTGHTVAGSRSHRRTAPLDRIPVFARPGRSDAVPPDFPDQLIVCSPNRRTRASNADV